MTSGDAQQPVAAGGTGLEGEVRRWLAAWGAEVAARDFDAAERRFSADVVGFGTRASVARGLRVLRAEQWEHVWPNIEGFWFDVASADVWVSPDGAFAVIGAAWSSNGRSATGRRFPRGGRATIALRRGEVSGEWRGVHTHFSLDPIDPGTYTGDGSV